METINKESTNQQLTLGTCRLCGEKSDLQHSHVIPGFAFRWMRDTSGTGYLRSGAAPNLRVQDGIKRHWLCSNCEELLNRFETLFATRIFHPFSSGKTARSRYGRWLHRFCVSVSWRVLQLYREEGKLKDYPPELITRIDEAEQAWKDVLLEKKPHPGTFEQHLLHLDAIESHTLQDLPPNMNRYLMRAIDTDFVRGGNMAFVYSKLGRFIILGFVTLDYPKQWVGTKVHATEGLLEPRKYIMPRQLIDYLAVKARQMAEIRSNISERQRAKIDQSFRQNKDKLVGSDLMKAMQEDIRLFGSAVFADSDITNKKSDS